MYIGRATSPRTRCCGRFAPSTPSRPEPMPGRGCLKIVHGVFVNQTITIGARRPRSRSRRWRCSTDSNQCRRPRRCPTSGSWTAGVSPSCARPRRPCLEFRATVLFVDVEEVELRRSCRRARLRGRHGDRVLQGRRLLAASLRAYAASLMACARQDGVVMTTMAHPGDRLADFVDGRLDAAAAAEVRTWRRVRPAAPWRRICEPRAVRVRPCATRRSRCRPTCWRRSSRSTPVPRSAAGVRGPRIHPVIRALVSAAAVAALVLLYLQVGTPRPLSDLPTLVRATSRPARGRCPSPCRPATPPRSSATSRHPAAHAFASSISRWCRSRFEGATRHSLAQPGRAASTATGRPRARGAVRQMYEGRLSDLPPPESIRDENGFHFPDLHARSRDGRVLAGRRFSARLEMPAPEVDRAAPSRRPAAPA